MRLEIRSNDRIGISQEILHIFSQYACNIRAMEVVTGVTYVHVNESFQEVSHVIKQLYLIEGVTLCQEIEQMPAEQRENHLRALLNRIPNPILDLDEKGCILALNKAAIALIDQDNQVIEGQNINDYLDQDITSLVGRKVTSHSLLFKQQAHIGEVSPVMLEGQIRGAVLMLRNMDSLGRQMALMQSQKEQGIEQIIGESETMQLLKQQTRRFAQLNLPVLIQGETGTGKELIARGLHQESSQREAAFLALNCAALPEHLLESELFGYASGAFTGAQRGGKPGLLELADGGTLFLDEIAEMSIYLQAKLLRFLQDYSFRRVGGNREVKVTVRIISATHQNLQQLIEQGKFRADLYYRLNVLNLVLPPLRQRGGDIALLAQHFILSASKQVNMSVPNMNEDALARLRQYDWPGNIRQLQNVLFRLVALHKGESIRLKDIDDSLSDTQASVPGDGAIQEASLLATSKVTNISQMDVANMSNWSSAQDQFEKCLLTHLYPLYPSTRKLAKRLEVSHNKIAMKLRQHGLVD